MWHGEHAIWCVCVFFFAFAVDEYFPQLHTYLCFDQACTVMSSLSGLAFSELALACTMAYQLYFSLFSDLTCTVGLMT